MWWEIKLQNCYPNLICQLFIVALLLISTVSISFIINFLFVSSHKIAGRLSLAVGASSPHLGSATLTWLADGVMVVLSTDGTIGLTPTEKLCSVFGKDDMQDQCWRFNLYKWLSFCCLATTPTNMILPHHSWYSSN